MSFAERLLSQPRPSQIDAVALPRRERFYPSPADWRAEVLYFLLPDRFSDGQEAARPLLDRRNLAAARPALPSGEPWRWDRWAQSGGDRWQGGTLRGITSKLGYLQRLGVTALWIGPIFKQRGHLDTFHGYGIQDFLDVDPRFGDRGDLVELVAAAHEHGLRVILDVIFNHSGANWLYPPDTPGGAERPAYTTGRYRFGAWRGDQGQPVAAVQTADEGVWPAELRIEDSYTRAGRGDLGRGALEDPEAEHKRSDFEDLRDFRLAAPGLLTELARCYKYWIALTDCDGFRIDTLKHVSFEEARNFCGTIKEFAANLGKHDFFLVGEVAGGDYNQTRYLEVLGRNLNAALDIGEMRLALNGVAKGLLHPRAYFDGFDPGLAIMGSHRNLGLRHVSVLDDHDHVFGEKVRFSSEAASDHQVAAGTALQLLTLGIPCIYYGTEQALAGPEPAERHWLPGWKGRDVYLREAMFGPRHPRRSGRAGLPPAPPDEALPGFGPFGTAGHHCFDEHSPAFARIAALTALRRRFPVLAVGRQYPRPISLLGWPFGVYGPGELVAWSRLLDDEEALCILNAHGHAARGADIIVDASLNPPGSALTVVLNTAQAAAPATFAGAHPAGSTVPVQRTAGGAAYVAIRQLPPSEVLVLTNHP
jgi:glycosidase